MQELTPQPGRRARNILRLSVLCLLSAAGVACTPADPDVLALVVSVGGRSMSKLPFVIAADQRLYEKHGLTVELRLPPPEFDGGIDARPRFWTRVSRRLGFEDYPEVDIRVNGHTPRMVEMTRNSSVANLIALAATDCSVRYYVIAGPGITSLEELKGKRLGIGADRSTAGFAALRLIERMGWDRVLDISVMNPGGVDTLRAGLVDAIVGGDGSVEAAEREGFLVLEDTRAWNEELAGNSVMVQPVWLEDETNREAARRFLRATVEAVALFRQQPALVLDVMARWHGISDRDVAQARYDRSDYVPRKPYPCLEGVRNTMALYDSNEMRRYAPEDFYDNSLMRELDESGFIDALYN